MLSRRIMIRLEPELMDRIEKTGASTHTPVSILVRQAIWARFGKCSRAKTKKTPRP